MPDSDKPTIPDATQTSLFPWQIPVWQKLYSNLAQQDSDHFPHALLLAGVAGIGKKQLALYLAKGLLCRSPQMNPQTGQIEPCQSSFCRSCQLFNAASHPDFMHISPPADKKVIPVDTIRELIQWSVLSSQLEAKKVILIEPAEAMNLNAANSLLKTLEEPVDNTIIILLSHKKQALLPTIRSRCQIVDLALPEKQIALQWLDLRLQSLEKRTSENAQLLLSLASGAPLRALELSHGEQLKVRNTVIEHLLSIINESADAVQVAEVLFKQTKIKSTKSKNKTLFIAVYDVIYWLDSIVSDLARLAQNCGRESICNIDLYDSLQDLSNRLYLKNILQLSDLINKAYYEIQGQVNINLLFESLFIDWKNCKK